MPGTPAWLATAEALLNRGVQSSAPALNLARRLEGTAVRVDIEGMMALRARVLGGRLLLAAASEREREGTADATLAGSPLALLRLATGGGSLGTSMQRPARVEGDAAVANGYRQLLLAAKPDWEEELSRVVGDLAARRLSGLAVRTVQWARGARRTAGRNVAEYLQEESRDLVSRPELEEFLQGVDTVREAADRVAARLNRLELRLQGAG